MVIACILFWLFPWTCASPKQGSHLINHFFPTKKAAQWISMFTTYVSYIWNLTTPFYLVPFTCSFTYSHVRGARPRIPIGFYKHFFVYLLAHYHNPPPQTHMHAYIHTLSSWKRSQKPSRRDVKYERFISTI